MIIASAAQNWYDEVTQPGFDTENISPFTFDYGTGHYSQVVWANTEELGCGMVHYQVRREENGEYAGKMWGIYGEYVGRRKYGEHLGNVWGICFKYVGNM